MKQTFTLAISAIFCFVSTINAQINKGSIMLGGTIGGNSYNLKSPDTSIAKSNSFTITPALGFAVNTNTILGFSLSYSSSNNKYYDATFKEKDHTYGAGVFLRKYKLLLKSLYLFGEGNLSYYHESYNYSKHISSYNVYDSKANSININFTPGIAYSLTRSIQLESGLQNLLYAGYSTSKETPTGGSGNAYKENSFAIGSSLNPVSFNNIFVGIRFLFNK